MPDASAEPGPRADPRSARIQARFDECMGDDSSQRIFTQLDAFRGRLWAQIASAETAAIIWWTMTSAFVSLGLVWQLGKAQWILGEWLLSAVLVILALTVAVGCGNCLPDASTVLDAEDVLWCIIIGILCTSYCLPQLILAQDLLHNFSDDLAESKGSYRGIFWSCVIAMVCVPLFANWHMIITRAWLATFRDYHVVADNSFDHKIVMLKRTTVNKAEQQPLVEGQALAADNIDQSKKVIYLEGCMDAECTIQTEGPAVLVSDHYGTWAITKSSGEVANGSKAKYEATIRVVAGEKLLIFRSGAPGPEMLANLRATSYDVMRRKPRMVFISSIMMQVKKLTWLLTVVLLIFALGLVHSTIPSLWDALVGEPLPCLIPLPDFVSKPGCINDVMLDSVNASLPSWGYFDDATGNQIQADVALYSQDYWSIMAYFVGFTFSSLIYGVLFCSLPVIVLAVWSAGNRLTQLNDLLMVHQWTIGGPEHRQALMLYKLFHLRDSVVHQDMRNFYELDVYPDFLLQPPANPAATDTFFWWFRTRSAIFADTSWSLMLVSPLLYLGALIVIFVVVGTVLLEATGGMVFPAIAYTVIDGTFFGAFMLGFMVCGSQVNDALVVVAPLMTNLGEAQNMAVQNLLAFEETHTMQLTFLGIPVGIRMLMSYVTAMMTYLISILIAVLKNLFVPWIFQYEPQE